MSCTRLNEMGYYTDWEMRQLAHVEGKRIRAEYNYTKFLIKRQEMSQ
jgi:hypothetical protein